MFCVTWRGCSRNHRHILGVVLNFVRRTKLAYRTSGHVEDQENKEEDVEEEDSHRATATTNDDDDDDAGEGKSKGSLKSKKAKSAKGADGKIDVSNWSGWSGACFSAPLRPWGCSRLWSTWNWTSTHELSNLWRLQRVRCVRNTLESSNVERRSRPMDRSAPRESFN